MESWYSCGTGRGARDARRVASFDLPRVGPPSAPRPASRSLHQAVTTRSPTVENHSLRVLQRRSNNGLLFRSALGSRNVCSLSQGSQSRVALTYLGRGPVSNMNVFIFLTVFFPFKCAVFRRMVTSEILMSIRNGFIIFISDGCSPPINGAKMC